MSDTRTPSRLPLRLLGLAAAGSVAFAAGCSASHHAAREPAADAPAPIPDQSPRTAPESTHKTPTTSGDPRPELDLATQTSHADEAAATRDSATPPIDYAAKLADMLAASQHAYEDASNRWSLYISLMEQITGAWSYFTASNEAIGRFEASDPKHRRTVTPLDILREPDAQHLQPEFKTFLDTLDRMNAPRTIEILTEPCRFLAPRVDGPLIDSHSPEIGPTRIVARIWAARMRLALDAHDDDRFVQSLRQLIAIQRAVAGGTSLLNGLVATAVRHLITNELRFAIMDGVLSGPEAASVLRLLCDHPPAANLGVMFECDRYQTLDTIDRLFDEVKKEAGAANAMADIVDGGLGVLATRDQQIEMANEFFDALAILVDPDSDVRSRDAANARLSAIDTRIYDDAQSPLFEPFRTCIPSRDNVLDAHRRVLAMEAGTHAMLALEVYRARTGRYPESLAELVPADISKLPDDPYADSRPLGYRRLIADAGDADNGYVLYTVGYDGEDDGGQPNAARPVNALGPSGRGFDYILNQRER